MSALPCRKKLPHNIPSWIKDDTVWFITINLLPRRLNHLCYPDVARAIWSTIGFNIEKGLWWPHLFLLMPDHLHGLFGFQHETGLRKIISNWKHYTAHKMGLRWQRDFFDHRLRKDESFVEKAYYIRQNPVRKGLVQKATDWPYIWTMEKEGAALNGVSALPLDETIR